MPKEQTSSTRLQLQVLPFTLSRMENRLTENHRKSNKNSGLCNNTEVCSVAHVIVAFHLVTILEDNVQYSHLTSC